MRDALSNVLGQEHEEASTDRILQAVFFRKRPLQAGSSAHMVVLAERRRHARPATRDVVVTTDGFLACGGER